MIGRKASLLVRTIREAVSSVGWDKASSRLGISLLVVSAVFFAANFADKAWVSYQVGQDKQQRIAAIAALEAKIHKDEQDLTYSSTRSYYMEAARNLGYVQPGDIQLQLTTQMPQSAAMSDHPAQAPAKTSEQHESLLHKLLQAVVPGL